MYLSLVTTVLPKSIEPYTTDCSCSLSRIPGNTRLTISYEPCHDLVVLRRNVPVNNFSVMSGLSHRFLGITLCTSAFRGVKCLAQGHNNPDVGFEPPTSRSGVRRSTTEPPRSQSHIMRNLLFAYAKTKAQISCVVTTQLISSYVLAK